MGDGSDAAGRVGQPDDITPIAVFLASDDPAWLTGEILLASGACAKDSPWYGCADGGSVVLLKSASEKTHFPKPMPRNAGSFWR
jgi:hypothetical protein